MKLPSLSTHPLPPRLTMDEYADFISETLRHSDPERMARQKKMEERVAVAFRLPAEPIKRHTRNMEPN